MLDGPAALRLAKMASQTTHLRDRLDVLQRLLAQSPPRPVLDVKDQTVTSDATLLRSLLHGIPEGRLRALSAELRSRADSPDIDSIDAVVMHLLLDAYRDAVHRVRTAVQITDEKLRRCTAEIREAKHLAQHRLTP